jgi:hypothetical protein
VSKSFRTESITKYILTTINTRWGATQMVMAVKLTRMTHKIAMQLHLVAESCTICSSRSRRAVRKLLDTSSYCRKPVAHYRHYKNSLLEPLLSRANPFHMFKIIYYFRSKKLELNRNMKFVFGAAIAQSGWTFWVLWFDFRRGLGIFPFTTASRTALGPTQPPIQWV